MDDMGWYKLNSHKTQLVGLKAPNAWGLCDMHGNVEEWCADYAESFLQSSSEAVTDPISPAFGDYRIVRGGSYQASAQGCRSACRRNATTHGNVARGFRPIMVP